MRVSMARAREKLIKNAMSENDPRASSSNHLNGNGTRERREDGSGPSNGRKPNLKENDDKVINSI